jgi:hypothetical protein
VASGNEQVNLGGRPASYTDEIGDKICEQLAKGKSLNSICKSDSMPDDSTVYRWLLATHNTDLDKFRDNYALAREIQYQRMSDEILDIADDGTNDYVYDNSLEGDLCRVNPEAIGRSRLRVDTRKWFMSKVLPKFKDKVEEKPVDDLAAAIMQLINRQPN